MALPAGAKWVYKAFGYDIPGDGHEEDPPLPLSSFEDELEIAAAILQSVYQKSEFPCLYDPTTGLWNPTDADLLLYNAALGLYTASIMAGGEMGAPGVGGPVMTKRKLMDIEYTFKTPDPADRATAWSDTAFAYMDAMSCVSGDAAGLSGFLAGGLLRVASPNTDENGRLTDNRGRPLESGWPYSAGRIRRERLF